jgi:mannose-6-phosphate isomerase-like protein (cupin superfamily)
VIWHRDYREHTGSRPDKHFKTTLFQANHLMVGLNCLEPGQKQSAHRHEQADKFYYVLEGAGHFAIGDEEFTAGAGVVVWTPAGVAHGVENRGTDRLTLLVGIAPPP